MNPELALSLALFAGLLFGLPLLCLKTTRLQNLWQSPGIYSLALYAAGGAIFYFGTVEMAGRYGLAGLLAFLVYATIFIFSPLFLAPMRWISRSQSFTSLPDLLVYRFRGVLVGRLTSLTLALTCLPIAMAQLKAMGGAATYLSAGTGNVPEITVMALTALAALLFLYLFGNPDRQKRVLPVVLAAGGSLALLALLAIGLLSIREVFGSFSQLNAWTVSSGQAEIIQRFDFGYALFMAFFAAALVQPQLMHLQSLGHSRTRSTGVASWALPLALLLATLPMFPLLWAGLQIQLDAPMQFYLTAIPSALDSILLVCLALVAGWMLCTGVLVTLALALGKSLTNNFIALLRPEFRDIELLHWLPRIQVRVACLWMLLSLVLAQLSASESLTDLSLAAMVGLAQLVPGLLATLYFPRINRQGFFAGLATGMLCWTIGFLAPLFYADFSSLIRDNPFVPLGLAHWPFWLLESTFANIAVTVIVSLMSESSAEEQRFAHSTMVDSLPAPRKSSLGLDSMQQARERLAQHIGAQAAAHELDRALASLQLDETEQRPLALRMLRDSLSFSLSHQMGTETADRIMERVMPLDNDGKTSLDDISLIETRLATTGSYLSGLAAELNKLRLYHRQTLENLPIGVCTLGPDGEILLWNGAMETNTGVRSDQIAGANIHNLADPWGSELTDFAASTEANRFAVRIATTDNDTRWFNLHKSELQESSPLYAGTQVLLVENITERYLLIRELAHSDRLAAVGRLAAGVAHEIGNPVTGISCLAQDIQSQTRDNDVQSMARMILQQTDRISSIVSTLVKFSSSGDTSGQSGQHAQIALTRPVQEAIKLLQLDKQAPEVAFSNQVPGDIEVHADVNQLTQVMVNVLDNARDASVAGDRVVIDAQLMETGWVQLSVTDQGEGIGEEMIGRVMEPFVTSKDPGEGTGLGLSLVYRIISNHGGSVKITSPVTSGRGTRVDIRLPHP